MHAHEIVRTVNVSYSRGPMHLWSNGQGFDVSMPIIDVKKDYLNFETINTIPVYRPDQSRLIVRGRSWVQMNQLVNGEPHFVETNYEKRWCTIPALDVAELIRIADRDGTIRETRMLSATAGVRIKFNNQTSNMETRYMGSEAALLLQMDGSPEAMALAEQYSFNHQIQRVITLAPMYGEKREQEITYVNAVLISKNAADAALGINTYPNEERVIFIPPKTDTDNPDWREVIEFARTVGRLPERQKREVQP